MLHYLTVNTVTEILCFIIAAICLSKDKSLAWRSMLLFLLITCIVELSGIYIRRLNIEDHTHLHRNEWLYNIFMIFQIYFLSYMFYHLLKKFNNPKRIIFTSGSLLIVLYIYEVYKHGVLKDHILTFTSMSVLFVLYGFFYFYYLHKDENYLELKTSPAFWWVAGILFFYFGATACNLFFSKFPSVTSKTGHSPSYYIFRVLNVILYSCWSYAFICRKWQRTNSEK